MATSPSDSGESPAPELSIPATATPAEAAAIAAAVGAHLRDRRAAAAAAGEAEPPSWSGRRWAFAGRTDAVGGRALRAPDGAPTDEWTTAGRLEVLSR